MSMPTGAGFLKYALKKTHFVFLELLECLDLSYGRFWIAR